MRRRPCLQSGPCKRSSSVVAAIVAQDEARKQKNEQHPAKLSERMRSSARTVARIARATAHVSLRERFRVLSGREDAAGETSSRTALGWQAHHHPTITPPTGFCQDCGFLPASINLPLFIAHRSWRKPDYAFETTFDDLKF
mmetsp:Transcript_44216/g.101327  ORF Transcript_44216/g.101327 Transcript_44216/m.101327 type:complete len:141 (+) Transcript_44216:558-980(+)